MNKFLVRIALFTSVILLASTAGCAQVPAGPIVYTCPVAVDGGTAYTPLNPSTNAGNPPVAGTTYKDTSPGAGQYCYIVQSWVAPNSSVPSNVAGPQAVTGTQSVTLTWTPPANSTGYTYVVSRAPAIAGARPTAPTQGAPTTAALVAPALGKPAAPGNLVARR